MTSLQNTIIFMLKMIALSIIASWVLSGTASAACGGNGERFCKIGFKCDKGYAPKGSVCRPCGKNGQPACQAARFGPRCINYTEDINGTCRARGGQGQSPYSSGIFDCKPGYNVGRDGKCTTCGHDGQPACEVVRKGPRCLDYTQEEDGYCVGGRGGEGEPPYSGIGYDCKPGFNVGRDGQCTACGHEGQPACEVTRDGPRCLDYTQEDDGYCVGGRGGEGEPPYSGIGFDCKPGYNVNDDNICTACGGHNQVTCEVMREGDICNEGLTQNHQRGRNICILDIASKAEEAAGEKLEAYARGLADLIVEAINTDNDETAVRSLQVAEANAANSSQAGKGQVDPTANTERVIRSVDTDESSAFCNGLGAKSWSVGSGGSANAYIGFGGEAGLAFPCDGYTNDDGDKFKWYAAGSMDRSAGGGADAGVTLGLWWDRYDALSGANHGFTLSITDAIQTIRLLNGADSILDTLRGLKQVSPDLSVGVWFARKDDDRIGRFLGISVTVSGAVGLDLGGTYSRGRTVQFSD